MNVAQMTRELSTEWSGRGIRVNAILPAQVMNPGLQERIEAAMRAEIFEVEPTPEVTVGSLSGALTIAGAKHEVMMETDALRGLFWRNSAPEGTTSNIKQKQTVYAVCFCCSTSFMPGRRA